MDGNGRVGRFLMNVMTASGGYPWTIILLKTATPTCTPSKKASVGEDIAPFADFVAGLVEKQLAGEPLPAVPQRLLVPETRKRDEAHEKRTARPSAYRPSGLQTDGLRSRLPQGDPLNRSRQKVGDFSRVRYRHAQLPRFISDLRPRRWACTFGPQLVLDFPRVGLRPSLPKDWPLYRFMRYCRL